MFGALEMLDDVQIEQVLYIPENNQSPCRQFEFH